jgi:hypothetical protein
VALRYRDRYDKEWKPEVAYEAKSSSSNSQQEDDGNNNKL